MVSSEPDLGEGGGGGGDYIGVDGSDPREETPPLPLSHRMPHAADSCKALVQNVEQTQKRTERDTE